MDLPKEQLPGTVKEMNTLLEQNTYAMPIGPDMPMAIVASPDYLKQRSAPQRLSQPSWYMFRY